MATPTPSVALVITTHDIRLGDVMVGCPMQDRRCGSLQVWAGNPTPGIRANRVLEVAADGPLDGINQN